MSPSWLYRRALSAQLRLSLAGLVQHADRPEWLIRPFGIELIRDHDVDAITGRELLSVAGSRREARLEVGLIGVLRHQADAVGFDPAAFPGVISVGAIGPTGPAWFTNYGPWVRACAPGVDVVSTFFTRDAEEFEGWARWSGTSFAAPAVVGALAAAIRRTPGLTAEQAVAEVVDDPTLMRIPGLGTVVNQGLGWLNPP